MSNCPCGSELNYEECCAPLIKGESLAETAEQLMRARYTAFAKVETDYLFSTLHPDKRDDYNSKEIISWAQNSIWHKLDIIETKKGGVNDDEGEVEFKAHFSQKGNEYEHHEQAFFKKIDNEWFFEDGIHIVPKPYVRETPKIGRNDPCPCNSGKKFKKCCGK